MPVYAYHRTARGPMQACLVTGESMLFDIVESSDAPGLGLGRVGPLDGAWADHFRQFADWRVDEAGAGPMGGHEPAPAESSPQAVYEAPGGPVAAANPDDGATDEPAAANGRRSARKGR